ncbi:hypothetical protein PSHT_13249 [Puccinia striiformis]|uniref:Uncharacterized protein n=1 Tax=Puccinia striiformis TaxID=27350 RepID=A0A2S4URW6_9BASI|nr:hypothetical protein PSHT_13249 [Puccinia striiformis]
MSRSQLGTPVATGRLKLIEPPPATTAWKKYKTDCAPLWLTILRIHDFVRRVRGSALLELERRGRSSELEAFARPKNPTLPTPSVPPHMPTVNLSPDSLWRVDSTPSNSKLFVLLTWHNHTNLLSNFNSCAASALFFTSLKRAIEAERCCIFMHLNQSSAFYALPGTGMPKMQLLMVVATLISFLCFLEGFSAAPIHHKHLQGRSPQAQYNRDGPQSRPKARPFTANARLKTSYNPFRPKPRPQLAHSRNDHGKVILVGGKPARIRPYNFWDYGGQYDFHRYEALL